MASGDTLRTFSAHDNDPPASNAATPDTRNEHLVLDFDPSTDQFAVFSDVMPASYSAATGVTVTIVWFASTATSGATRWGAAFERIAENGQDIDSDGFAAFNEVNATTQSTSGKATYTTITFTAGADMDSVVAGSAYRLKITRNANHGSDTMSGDAEFKHAEIKDT